MGFGPTYVAHIPPLEGWYSRDSLCYGVGARVAYISAKAKKILTSANHGCEQRRTNNARTTYEQRANNVRTTRANYERQLTRELRTTPGAAPDAPFCAF